MIQSSCYSVRSCLFTTTVIGIALTIATALQAQTFDSVTPLSDFTAAKNTGDKPQSKVWQYDGKWWSVFPNRSGTYIYRLDGTTWNTVLKISASTVVRADCKVIEDVCHIFLWKKADFASQLVSVEYVPSAGNYQLWSKRPSSTLVKLDSGVEIGTIDIDATGRMWLASDGVDDIRVRWSDPPYTTWSAPVIVASGVYSDDICSVISMPQQGQVGIFWSNQNTKRFGFKTHINGTDPAVWSADEIPAAQSALDIRRGMCDDHLNLKVASDGTLYCAAKTGYDTPGYPLVILLKRDPNGIWNDPYEVAQTGTRPIAILNEAEGKLKVIYTSQEGGGDILYRESPLHNISFGPVNTLISGVYDNPSSTKNNYDTAIVILASFFVSADTSTIVGVLAYDKSAQTIPPAPELVSPANLSQNADIDLTFAWNAVPNAGSYQIQVARSADFSSLVYEKDSITDTSLEPGAILNNDTQYYWRARAANTAGYGDWSAAWSFRTRLPREIAGYWKLDEGNGTLIIDESAYANNGQTKGAPAWVNGVNGSALRLNGSNQYITIQDSPSLDISKGITLAAWVRPQKNATQQIIFKGSESTDGYQLSLSRKKKVSMSINQRTSNSYEISSRKSYPVNGAWTHIAGTFDGTVLKIFINGVADRTIVFSVPASIGINDLPLTLGASANARDFFKGTLDDVRIYNYALSDNEIRELVSGPATKNTATARTGQPIAFHQTTGSEIGENKIRIHPNPVYNTLFVDVPAGSESIISISDMHGNILYKTITSSNLTINLNELNIQRGLYLLRGQSSGSLTTLRFFKK